MLNGVESSSFEPSIPESPPRFVAVGSVIAQKGFDLLVEAASLAHVPWSAEIVGDGPHLTDLQGARPIWTGRSASSVGGMMQLTTFVRRPRSSSRPDGKHRRTWPWRPCNTA